MLNLDNIRRWTTEMRTTDLPQGTGHLHTKQGYCCLGLGSLLADVERRSVVDDLAYVDDDDAIERFGANGEEDLAPIEFIEWLGVQYGDNGDLTLNWPSGDDTLFQQEGDQEVPINRSLSELNDDGFTFEQIADLIDYFGLREISGA